jgi:hypothetical protein
MALSGSQWVSKFPTSASIEDLSDPFRGNARRFIAALRQAQASVVIADTLRRPERAYLMHFAFAIARESADPSAVPAMPGVDIQWVHPDAEGQPDLAASRAAAEQMVQGYGIVFKPALTSRHTEGEAIDMTITWQNDLVIATGDGANATISSSPRNGAGNADLHQVGISFGVIKLLSDPPHWSSDGH